MAKQRRDITDRVRAWYQERPGIQAHVTRVIKELDLRPDQVHSACARLARNNELKRTSYGVYVYAGRPSIPINGALETGDLIEVIGKTAEGAPIGRTTDGVLYRMVSL